IKNSDTSTVQHQEVAMSPSESDETECRLENVECRSSMTNVDNHQVEPSQQKEDSVLKNSDTSTVQHQEAAMSAAESTVQHQEVAMSPSESDETECRLENVECRSSMTNVDNHQVEQSQQKEDSVLKNSDTSTVQY